MRSEVFAKLLLHHGFVIRPVADVHLGDRVAFEGDDVGADAVEEPAVVRSRDASAIWRRTSFATSAPALPGSWIRRTLFPCGH